MQISNNLRGQDKMMFFRKLLSQLTDSFPLLFELVILLTSAVSYHDP